MSEFKWPSDNTQDWGIKPFKDPWKIVPFDTPPFVDPIDIDTILKDCTSLKKSYTKDKQTFAQAYIAMRGGKDIRLPEWEGYWYWDDNKNTIMIHCFDGNDMDIRESKDMSYTMGFIIRNDWIIVL